MQCVGQPPYPMLNPSRRKFLKNTALVAGAMLTARSWAQVAGANGDVRVAVVGLNGRGKNHLTSLAKVAGVRIAAICDVDTAILESVAADLAKDGLAPEKFTDLRALLASPGIDAITVATPNHWHALAAIWACQAGKDVYVEKPVSHNIWEGRQLVAAAAKYNRVVQAGVQIRSGEGLIEAVDWVRSGQLGRITAARGFCYKRRKSIGHTPGTPTPPPTVNYDLWLGPAREEPPHRTRFHYDWHWFNTYGNGDVGNQGIHQMDVARWFLGESGLPRSTLSIGGRLGYKDDGETPNTQIIVHDYATAPLIFEVRGLPAKYDPAENQPGAGGAEAAGALAASMDKYRGFNVGNVIDCEGGSVVTGSYFSATAYDRDGKVVREFHGQDRHMQNFIDVVRSRKTKELYGPIDEGHISSALCHLGGISHRTGHAVSPDERKSLAAQADQIFGGAYRRLGEHLAANQIDPEKYPLTMGMPLSIDKTGERFLETKPYAWGATAANAAQANPLLTRDYRAPYTVPQLA